MDCVEKWREIARKVMEGRFDKERDGYKLPMPGQQVGGRAPDTKNSFQKPPGGDTFIKI